MFPKYFSRGIFQISPSNSRINVYCWPNPALVCGVMDVDHQCHRTTQISVPQSHVLLGEEEARAQMRSQAAWFIVVITADI